MVNSVESDKPPPKKSAFATRAVVITQEWPAAHEIAEPFLMRSPQSDKWAIEFFEKELPLLEELWLKYKIPPAEIVEAVTLSKFAPVADSYPKRLRSSRLRKRLAAQYEKLAARHRELSSVNDQIWGVNVLDQSDTSLDLRLEEIARKIRALRSIPGKPEKRMRLRVCAHWLSEIFERHTPKRGRLNLQIAELLSVAFSDQWRLHGRNRVDVEQAEISAVKDLLRPRRRRYGRAALDQRPRANRSTGGADITRPRLKPA